MLTKQFGDNGLSYHDDLGGFLDVFLCEALTILNLPLLDVQILCGLTVHRCVSVIITIDDLSACRHLR